MLLQKKEIKSVTCGGAFVFAIGMEKMIKPKSKRQASQGNFN
jgi:hypothetical protein